MRFLLAILITAQVYAATICGAGSICVGDTYPRIYLSSAVLTAARANCTADANRTSCTGTDSTYWTALRTTYDTYLTTGMTNNPGTEVEIAEALAYMGAVSGYSLYSTRAVVFVMQILTEIAATNYGWYPGQSQFGNRYAEQVYRLNDAYDWANGSFSAGQKTTVNTYLDTVLANMYNNLNGAPCGNLGNRYPSVSAHIAITRGDQTKFDTIRGNIVNSNMVCWTTGVNTNGFSVEGAQYGPYAAQSLLSSYKAILTGTGEDVLGAATFPTNRLKWLYYNTLPAVEGGSGNYQPTWSGVVQSSSNYQSSLTAILRWEGLLLASALTDQGNTTQAQWAQYWLNTFKPDWTQGSGVNLKNDYMIYDALWGVPGATATNFLATATNANWQATNTLPSVGTLTSWSALSADATVARFDAGPVVHNHTEPQAGHFQIARCASGACYWLVNPALAYDGMPSPFVALHSEYHNVMILKDQGQRSNGQQSYSMATAGYGQSTPAELTTAFARADISNATYTVAQADLASAYNIGAAGNATLDSYTRDFLHVKPDLFFIHDRWAFHSGSQLAKWQLQTPGTLTQDAAGRVKVTNGTMALYVNYPTTLTPYLWDRRRLYVSSVTKGAVTTDFTIMSGDALSNGITITLAGATGASCADGGTDPCVVNGARAISYTDSTDKKHTFHMARNTSNVSSFAGQSIYYTGTMSGINAGGKLMLTDDTPATSGKQCVTMEATASASAATALTHLTGSGIDCAQAISTYVFAAATTSAPASFSYSGFSTASTLTHYNVSLEVSTKYDVDTTTTPGTAVVTKNAASGAYTADAAGTLIFTSVPASGLDHFDVAGFTTPTVAGVLHSGTVTAKRADGTTITTYAGTPIYTSTDPQAVISCAAFVNGVAACDLTLKTAGISAFNFCATDSGATGCFSSITVTAAAAASCTLSEFPNPVQTGIAQNATMTVVDAFGNAQTPTGNNTASSNDGSATLPGVYVFTAGETSHVFSFTLVTAGAGKSITETNAGGSFNCSQTGITVIGPPGYMKAK